MPSFRVGPMNVPQQKNTSYLQFGPGKLFFDLPGFVCSRSAILLNY